jgi:hypothetical protein
MSQSASIPGPSSAACQAARSGAYLLAPAHALGLFPRQPSELRITCGQAWVTFGDGMDHFLQAGQALRVPAARHVVLESLHGTVLKFDFRALPARVHASAPATQPLRQAGRDLRAAGALAVRGLLGLGWGLAALARSAASSASRAQGRIASGESMASSGAV